MTERVSDLTADLAGTAMEVSYLYGFLASIYRAELSQELFRSLQAAEMQSVLAAAGIDMKGGFWDRPEASLLEEMAVEFTALFLGPGGHISPHESVQIEHQGAYWGDATTAVRNFIIATGIEYHSDFQGIPDHISVELEFLAELSRRESEAWRLGDLGAARNCLEYQRDFLDEHLGRWVGVFCTRIANRAELKFYRQVAQLTELFIGSEIIAVEERLELCLPLASSAAGRNAMADSDLAPV